ncbi:MAG TPA: iron-sulfur cluster assembly scaffold protein [Candidatus Tumulicola sp.]|jgi:NifU-like protein involved in Fe-S cluster formation
MDFPKFQRLVEERSGFRTMENPTASGEYFSDSCGDMYNFFLKVGPGAVIEDISYFTTGCGFGTATCSLVVDLARGKTIDGASAITGEQVEAELDGYPEKKKDYPQRALEALHVAIDDYRAKIASGAIEDLSSLPARAIEPASGPVVAAVPDEKLLIKLH